MEYAVVNISGKQYRVKVGDEIAVDRLLGKEKDKLSFEEVILITLGEKTILGTPYIAKAKIETEILGQFKEKKIRVAKFRAKSRYRKVFGSRQLMTRLKILKIICPK